jgi:peptidyl-prolyl cis-trans isomerase B (cyclophilin B)
MNGQLVTVQEQAGEAPNGTGFTITTAPAPELDATNLVVGRVVEGMDVVARISQVGLSQGGGGL